MATSKPDILIILLQKLMEEGNLLYKVSTFRRACSSRATYRTKRRKKKETVMDDLVLKAERTNQPVEAGGRRREAKTAPSFISRVPLPVSSRKER